MNSYTSALQDASLLQIPHATNDQLYQAHFQVLMTRHALLLQQKFLQQKRPKSHCHMLMFRLTHTLACERCQVELKLLAMIEEHAQTLQT